MQTIQGRGGAMPLDLEAIKADMQENLAEIRTIEDVARRNKISAETLKKEFLRKEGIGISEYLARTRVETMKHLLAATDEKCIIICLRAGCREDVGERLFKRLTGMTMEEFRRRQRDGAQEAEALYGKREDTQ
jgi:transcriptional regulator GlxA family with amidase domain